MAEAVVSFAMQRIEELLIQKINLLRAVAGEVRELQEELELMRRYLKDADSKDKSGTIQFLVVKIRGVAYDVENVIETFAARVALKKRQRIQNIIGRSISFCNEVKVRYDISSKIRSLKSEISKISTKLQTYGFVALSEREGSGSDLQRRGRLQRTYSHTIEEDFVGFEKDVKELVVEVVSEAKPSSVIFVCGMGGLGKTTVARKIYHDQDVRRRFDAFAWASISQQWVPKDVLQRILVSLRQYKNDEFGNNTYKKDEFGNNTVEQLVKSLNKFVQEKKCLIVLDDIWSHLAWDDLSAAFYNMKFSKILITTRNKDVALHMDQSVFPTSIHVLPLLTKEQSWILLQKKAEGAALKIDTEKENLGKEMVEKCHGLPLAIVVLGGILALKPNLRQWQEVHRNVSSYLEEDKSHEGQHRNVKEVLALSYQDLPYRLKACFLYVGSYPEDSWIEVDKLYQLWMAEGFIPAGKNGDETMMDVAEIYLDELAQRCMVQVSLSEWHSITGRGRRYRGCQIHDLLRDLCLSKMEEENFLNVIDNRKNRCTPSSSSMPEPSTRGSNRISNRNRRLATYSDNDTDNDASNYLLEQEVQEIRSILFFNGYSKLQVKSNHFLKKFKMLRLLDLECCEFGVDDREKRLPKEIGSMVLLRYLGLAFAKGAKLSASIGNLRFLQTLDLRGMEGDVPDVLWKIEGLMHLYLPYSYGKRLRIDGLSNLETLENFSTDFCDPKDLFSLTKLRRLEGVEICQSLDHLQDIINYLRSDSSKWLLRTSIHNLCCDLDSEKGLSLLTELLRVDCLYLLDIAGNVGKLPQYDPQCCKNLIILFLTNSNLEEDSMATLEKLPNLRDLTLRGNVFKIKCMVCSAHGFPRLTSLALVGMNLEEWTVDEGAMPTLSEIEITGCYNLKMLPDGLKSVTTLRTLTIRDMPEAFKNGLRAVTHIPNIQFLSE